MTLLGNVKTSPQRAAKFAKNIAATLCVLCVLYGRSYNDAIVLRGPVFPHLLIVLNKLYTVRYAPIAITIAKTIIRIM